MAHTNTSPGNAPQQDLVTQQLHNIMRQMGIEPQVRLPRTFTCWEELYEWDQRRGQQEERLGDALDRFQEQFNRMNDHLQAIQVRYTREQTEKAERNTALATRFLTGFAGLSLLASLLLAIVLHY